jgi:biopolymer transport protein ExbB/TolQ/uncharacterized protein YukE
MVQKQRPSAHGSGQPVGVWVLWVLALGFPAALAVFDPPLVFQRGWEQYVGIGLYTAALGLLARELLRLRYEDRAFADVEAWVNNPGLVGVEDRRPLAARIRSLATGGPGHELLERVREASSLDQEQTAARFTLTRYILYLLPVIGFIGTVEGISKALVNMSRVLPLVKELDGFLANLTSVTASLQIAFDSTLLALFLSAWLMLVQTLVQRRAEDHLVRVDRFTIEVALPRMEQKREAGQIEEPGEDSAERLAALLERLEPRLREAVDRLDGSLGMALEQFGETVDRLIPTVHALEVASGGLSRLDTTLAALPDLGRKANGALGRIEAALEASNALESLDAVRRGVDRVAVGVETMAEKWSEAVERSNRSTQEQLARTLTGLKDALELLHVATEQSNALYRSIVKRLVSPVLTDREDRAA